MTSNSYVNSYTNRFVNLIKYIKGNSQSNSDLIDII